MISRTLKLKIFLEGSGGGGGSGGRIKDSFYWPEVPYKSSFEELFRGQFVLC